jgi:F-type H+-transporting ATPase subunit epsilon
MWRQAAKVSYLQYTNDMANILRECLKEPYREKALKSAKVWMKERIFQNGAEVSKSEISDLKEAFKAVKKQ